MFTESANRIHRRNLLYKSWYEANIHVLIKVNSLRSTMKYHRQASVNTSVASYNSLTSDCSVAIAACGIDIH